MAGDMLRRNREVRIERQRFGSAGSTGEAEAHE
jgi:hypothetical protein